MWKDFVKITRAGVRNAFQEAERTFTQKKNTITQFRTFVRPNDRKKINLGLSQNDQWQESNWPEVKKSGHADITGVTHDIFTTSTQAYMYPQLVLISCTASLWLFLDLL